MAQLKSGSTAGGNTIITDADLGNLAYLDSISASSIPDGAITAAKLNTTGGNGTAGQALTSDGDGSFTWADAGPSDLYTLASNSPSVASTSYIESATVNIDFTYNTSYKTVESKTFYGGDGGTVSVRCGAREGDTGEYGASTWRILVNGVQVASASSSSSTMVYSSWVSPTINNGQTVEWQGVRSYNSHNVYGYWAIGIRSPIDKLLWEW